MADPRLIVVDNGGTILSENNAETHSLFSGEPHLHDTASCRVKVDTAGWQRINAPIGCSPGIALSFDGVNYGTEGSLDGSTGNIVYSGPVFFAGVLLYVQCVSVQAGPVWISLPQGGCTIIEVDTAMSADVLADALSLVGPAVTSDANLASDVLANTATLPSVQVLIAGQVYADVLTLSGTVPAPSVVPTTPVTADVLTMMAAMGGVLFSGLLFEDSFASLANWCAVDAATGNISDSNTVHPEYTAASSMLHWHGDDLNAYLEAVKSTALSNVLADCVVQMKLATGASAWGTGTDNNDSHAIIVRHGDVYATSGQGYMLLFGRMGTADASNQKLYVGNPGWAQLGSTQSNALAAASVVSLSALGTAIAAYRNGVAIVSATDVLQTAGRVVVWSQNYSGNGTSHDIADKVTVMAGPAVTVTSLPSGYKAELTDAWGVVTVKVTASSGTAVVNGLDTSVTALASGSNFCYSGGATLKIYDGSNTLMRTYTGMFGGGTIVYA
jgi:hypothetical protein